MPSNPPPFPSIESGNSPAPVAGSCACRRLIASAGVAAVAGAGLYVVRAIPPAESQIYPTCIFHALTGLHCPGCGGTRCIHALLNLRFAEAAHQNLLVLVAAPVVMAWIGKWWWRWVRHRPPLAPRLPKPWMAWTLILSVLIFGVARNLPWEPFSSLAPR